MSWKRHIRNLLAAVAVLALLLPLSTSLASATTAPTGGVELRPGEKVTSPDGRYQLVHQRDGNVVLYEGLSRPVWNTRTAGRSTSHLVFQDDGNLVLYGDGGPVWHTRTYGKGQALAVQNDANLVVYGDQSPVWAIKGMTPPLDVRGSTGDGCGGWGHTVGHYFGAEKARACRVLVCESGGEPNAKNPRSTASGLFQFLDSTWRSTTGTPAPARAYSPSTQVAAAKRLRDTGGWGHWVCK